MDTPLATGQIVAAACLYAFAAIALLGGTVQMTPGLPEPRAVWLGHLAPELVLPWVLAVAHHQPPLA